MVSDLFEVGLNGLGLDFQDDQGFFIGELLLMVLVVVLVVLHRVVVVVCV